MDGNGEQRKSCCAALYELPLVQALLGPSLHPGGDDLTLRLAEAAVVGRGSRVLDVASGTGHSARLLARKRGAHVTGVDLSAANVDRATAFAEQAGLGAQTAFVVGDAERLPFDDEAFDVVVCECALCTFPNRDLALREMRRVLVPLGRIALSDVLLESRPPSELDAALGSALCITGALSSVAYQHELDTAGFRSVRFRDTSHVVAQMVADIERRLGTLGPHTGLLDGLPSELHADAPAFRAARDFARGGGLGYGLFTARKGA